METEYRWSELTERVLREAGWYPGRQVPTGEWETRLNTSDGFVMHEAARTFLAEFGGIAVPHGGPGKDIARVAFRLDPMVAEHDYEIFEPFNLLTAEVIYPIGEADNGNEYLGIASDGAVYGGMDALRLIGEHPRKALNNLVEGIMEHELKWF